MKNRLLFWCLLPVFLVMLLLYTGTVLTDAASADTGKFSVSDSLKKVNTHMQLLLGNHQIDDVYVTEEALFSMPDTLSEQALEQTAEAINTFYADHQISTCVIAVPDAAAFYGDAFPETMPLPVQKPQVKAFYAAIDMQIRKTDAYYILETATDDYIYYRTSPYWTSYGAYNVYRSAIQKMGFAPVSYDQYTVTHVKQNDRGALYQACLYNGVTPDLIDLYEHPDGNRVISVRTRLEDGTWTQEQPFYNVDALETDHAYAFYPGAGATLQRITTDEPNGKRLLVIKDEWANCMIPFLTQHYQQICLVDAECGIPLSELVTDVSAYHQVLFLCNTDTYAEAEAFSVLLEKKNT